MCGEFEKYIFNLISSPNDIDINIFRKFINIERFDSNAVNEQGIGFLMTAVTYKKLKMFTELLKNDKINVNFSFGGGTLLFNILMSYDVEFAFSLKNANEILLFASELIKHKSFDINYRTPVTRRTLINIVMCGSLESLQFVLNCKNIDINVISEHLTLNALMLSLNQSNSLAKFKLLINQPNIDVNVVNKFNDTVLRRAIQNECSIEILKLLINFKDIDIHCKIEGLSILEYAIFNNNFKACSYLIQKTDVDYILSDAFYRKISIFHDHANILQLYNHEVALKKKKILNSQVSK